jgi:hypothetical protein
MRQKLSLTFIFASLIAVATTVSINQPSYAEGTKFYCDTLGGEYFTFARTEDGRRYRVMPTTTEEMPILS